MGRRSSGTGGRAATTAPSPANPHPGQRLEVVPVGRRRTVCAPYARAVSDAYYDLGDYHRPVATTSSAAQVWFDRGLVWAYAFNHEEAVTCFEKALEEDPDLWAAHWGIA